MKRSMSSTALVGFALAAYFIFVVLKFTGLVGNDKGEVPSGMIIMMVLLTGLLLADLRRNKRSRERSNG